MTSFLELPEKRQAQAIIYRLYFYESKYFPRRNIERIRRCVREPEFFHELSVRDSDPCRVGQSSGLRRGIVPKEKARKEIYNILTAEFGDECMCCGVNIGALIDHDHFTGVVRGLVCHWCNNWVDWCLHGVDSGCHRAQYVEFPPAYHLGLAYPGLRVKASAKRRDIIELLGFDPYGMANWPSPPSFWTWVPPKPGEWAERPAGIFARARYEQQKVDRRRARFR